MEKISTKEVIEWGRQFLEKSEKFIMLHDTRNAYKPTPTEHATNTTKKQIIKTTLPLCRYGNPFRFGNH